MKTKRRYICKRLSVVQINKNKRKIIKYTIIKINEIKLVCFFITRMRYKIKLNPCFDGQCPTQPRRCTI